MRICFPDFHIESHRRPWMVNALISALAAQGISCVSPGSADLLFSGSFVRWQKCLAILRDYPDIPVVMYNWDLYPFNFDKSAYAKDSPYQQTIYNWWNEYLEGIRNADTILVPSKSAQLRTMELAGRESTVVLCAVNPLGSGIPIRNDGPIVNVMRRYPADPNCDLFSSVCEELELDYVDGTSGMTWESYHKTIAEASVLVSPYYEASTGSLSLLEGYTLGKRVLVADSPYNGARDYFGDRATYFQWNSRGDFIDKLLGCLRAETGPSRLSCLQWVLDNYSNTAFAKRLKSVFERTLDERTGSTKAVSESSRDR